MLRHTRNCKQNVLYVRLFARCKRCPRPHRVALGVSEVFLLRFVRSFLRRFTSFATAKQKRSGYQYFNITEPFHFIKGRMGVALRENTTSIRVVPSAIAVFRSHSRHCPCPQTRSLTARERLLSLCDRLNFDYFDVCFTFWVKFNASRAPPNLTHLNIKFTTYPKNVTPLKHTLNLRF
ncbi:hypothetical protein CCV52592_2222 [Campylobacter curvus 525.92]|uniref:Uncharacterized protein n=1 Tax=Campylobacter curvus (strain 525.92) TaxID=360105 RepID=A7GZW5_CAMC5|nr:hypothetical protein CCV52592_2222 [Campylobacter curvus 525.92]